MLSWLRKNAFPIFLVTTVATVGMIFFSWGMQGSGGQANPYAAMVDGVQISHDEYEARIRNVEDRAGVLTDTDRRRIAKAVMEQMIREVLVRREAGRMGLGVLPEEVVQYVQQAYFRGADGQVDMTGYNRALRQTPARDWRRLERDIRGGLEVAKVERYVLSTGGTAPPEEVRQYYDWKYDMAVVRHVLVEPAKFVPVERARAEYAAHPDSYLIPERARLRHVLYGLAQGAAEGDRITARTAAEEARLSIRSGADFDRLYARVRDDSEGMTAAEDLEWLYRGSFPGFETFAFHAPVGAVSEVVPTQFGFHILRVDDREETHVRPFSEVVDSIRERLAGETEVNIARARAESAAAEIAAGKPFEEVARRYSTAPSAAAGGVLGAVARGDLTADVYGEDSRPIERIRKEAGRVEVREGRLAALLDPAFADAAFALEPGGVSGIVASARGFHVIRLDGRRSADPLLFEARAPDLEAEYTAQKRQEGFRLWVDGLRRRAEVEYDPRLKDLLEE